MNQQDLLRTIQNQQLEISQLRQQLSISQSTNFQIKYKKALRQISGIIKANKQLKEELIKLSNLKNAQNESFGKINKDELGKAYEKILKEKNQLLGQKQAILIQNQKLKYQVISLQEAVARLKNQKMALARQKQGAAKLNYLQKSPEGGSNQKQREKDGYYKEKQIQLRKTLDNYEERHASLSRANRKLQQQINELENKLFKTEQQYKTKLNEKDVEVKVSKSAAREEYQSQIASLKREVNQLKMHNNQLSARIGTYQEQRHCGDAQNEYEEQLIETLRQLRSQMEPMSAQIAQLQEKNQFEREQAQRERASLQIKVIQYEAQIERTRESHKLLQQKLIKQTEKSRKWDEAQRTVRKLQEQNRMLGGRIIVLEAKQVALRNRSGDDLQERVLEFQTRVEMLLNDKQTIANMKNVGIHQLIALKTYILQLDAKLKQVVNENQYATKKYKSYKQKCAHLIRELKQHDIAINALKGKLQGYDRLVVKLQGELERAITINDNQMKAINVKISESTMTSIDIYKKRYESLLEKLSLQQKYAEQQIQTLKLNYDTKLIDLNMKLQELNSVKDTIGLYKSKNEELSNKLTQKQNELLETKMTKVIITDTIPQPKNLNKEAINKLNETINTKESTIINLQNQLKKLEQEWKGKYNQLQQSTNAALSKKSRQEQEQKREIQHLEQQIRNYRSKINQLQTKTLQLPSARLDDGNSSFKMQRFTGKISQMQVQLEEMRNRYEIETTKVSKLSKATSELKQINGDLEAQISRLKFQIKRLEKELQMTIQEKDNEIKRLQNRGEESRLKRTDSDTNTFKINSLKMQLQMSQGQIEQLQRDKTRYYNKTLELEREISELQTKIQQLNYALQRSKNAINNDLILQQTSKQQQIQRLQYNLKTFRDKNADLEDRIGQYQTEINRIRNQMNRQRQRYASQLDIKDEEILKISRELNRIRNDVLNQDDIRDGIRQQYEYKVNRLNSDVTSLRDQIESYQNEVQRLESEIRFLRSRQIEYNNKAQSQQNYVYKLTNDIKNLQNKQIQLQHQLMDKETLISKLTNEITLIRNEISTIETTIETKQTIINRLNNDLNTLKNNQLEWQLQLTSKQGDHNKLNSELIYARNRADELQHEVQSLKSQISRLKTQSQLHQQNYFHQTSQIQEKEMAILRLQSDIRSKVDHISELQSEINIKIQKINQLQNDTVRFRSLSAEYENDVIDKNQQISKLTYELTNLRTRYQNLEQEHENKDSNWMSLNRQLATIRAQLGQYEDDINMKNLTIERCRNDISELTKQINQLHDEVFEKNATINNLNQELFKIKLQTENAASDQIYQLQNQIYTLKARATNLQGELSVKEDELSRVRIEISAVRSNVTVNRYTDEEYDLLQAQYYQVQKSLSEIRNQISEKDLEITQLEAKIEFIKKNQAQSKRRWAQQRQDLETQLQNVLNRERQLRNQVQQLQNEAYLANNRNTEQKQFGLQLYQQECDRLTKITEDLQEEVNSLKLKLTYMTNQQDRIIENLTLMTLTFAEVQALRERMKTKENQISEVRKSLLNFASSSEQINSMSSRTIVKERKLVQHKQNQQFFQPSYSPNIYTTEALYNRPEAQGSNTLFMTQGNKGRTQFDNLSNIALGQTNIITYVPQYQSQQASLRTGNFDQGALASGSGFTQGYSYQYHASFSKPPQVANANQSLEQNLQTVSSYGTSSLPYQGRNVEEEEQYHIHQTADRRLNELANSITGTNLESQDHRSVGVVQSLKTDTNVQGLAETQNKTQQANQASQHSQNISQSQGNQQSQQSQQSLQIQGQNLPAQGIFTQNFPSQQSFPPPQVIFTPQQITSSFNQQIQAQQSPLWRYGSAQQPYPQLQPQTQTQPHLQGQIPQNQGHQAQSRGQSQVKVSFGSTQNVGKALSPSPQGSFSGPAPQIAPTGIQIQGRPINTFQPQPFPPGLTR